MGQQTEPMVTGDCLISVNVANNIKTSNTPKTKINIEIKMDIHKNVIRPGK